MKIAVTSRGKSLDGAVDPRFQRASGALIYDTESKETFFIEKVNGRGRSSGNGKNPLDRKLISKGVEIVLTGHCGPEAFKTLAAAKVDVYLGITGTVRGAIKKFIKGELHKASSADVVSQW